MGRPELIPDIAEAIVFGLPCDYSGKFNPHVKQIVHGTADDPALLDMIYEGT